MHLPNATLHLLAHMGDVASRRTRAQELAAHLGAQDVLLFVLDPVVEALVPARGMPATLAAGPLWRRFLAQCRSDGRHQAIVDWPKGTSRSAIALVGFEVAVVLIGGEPYDQELATLQALLPLLASALVAQHQVASMKLEARESRAAASKAHSLAQALDAARAAGEQLNAELRDKDMRKDEFLAMLAHELRNPLATLVTSVEVLKRTASPTEQPLHNRPLDVMARQLQHLTRLVGDLLDVSRVSRGMIELQLGQFDLRDMLQEVLEENRPVREARRMHLDAVLGNEPLVVTADRVRLAQVFGNLLHNAVKYSDDEARISVSSRRDGSTVVVAVRDTGAGLPPDMQDKVFDLFTQVRVTLDRSQGGLGIGLTLVRNLVTLHQGEVHAESEGLGKGSTFTVVLPLSEPACALATALPFSPETSTAARVLVVDDNMDAADSLAEMLKLLGHDAAVAYLGQVALQAVPNFRPHIVFLDIGLPDLNGYEVAKQLRRTHGQHLRLVALTGYGTQADRQHAGDAGFDAHLVKPPSLHDIESAIALSHPRV